MKQYILINQIKVQGANAISGFTWGFPAVTHFLGFTHNLSIKLNKKGQFKNISLGGCAIISHNTQVYAYGSSYDKHFTQSRNPPYLESLDSYEKKSTTPPIIEEGKMNMTVSLLIEYNGDVGNKKDEFLKWLKNACYLQRLAGGTILTIKDVQLFGLDEQTIHQIKRLLLPGFVLMDRANYLQEHYEKQQQENTNSEIIDSWLDFISLKQKARPISDLINSHFVELSKDDKDNQVFAIWHKHLESPYRSESIPKELIDYFAKNDFAKKLKEQWQNYCNPSEKTDANWEYLPRPHSGYLVPIMTGYKAISEVYDNSKIENTRDDKTDVCFVESVHSIGEWLSAHRLNMQELQSSVWNYSYKENWYLCKQAIEMKEQEKKTSEKSDDNF